MIAIVTTGSYSDTCVDFVEHPDREELMSTLRALADPCDLNLLGLSERVELFGGAEPRRPITLAEVARPHVVKTVGLWPNVSYALRQEVLGSLPVASRRDALSARLAGEKQLLEYMERQRMVGDADRQRALCALLEAGVAAAEVGRQAEDRDDTE